MSTKKGKVEIRVEAPEYLDAEKIAELLAGILKAELPDVEVSVKPVGKQDAG